MLDSYRLLFIDSAKMVDPASSNLGRMLTDEITPVIMVLRTPLVEETSQKNGLSFIEMLSPFCAFNNIDGLFGKLIRIA